MRRNSCLFLAFTLIAATTGCGRLLATSDYDPFQGSRERRLNVMVVNESFMGVTVTAVRPGQRLTLGRVDSNSRNGFSIPWSMQREVRFLIEVSGGQSFTTPPIMTSVGDRLEVWVRNPLQRSVVRR